jgi:hypothetical protein
MITCPSCDASIPDDAVRPARKMAVCPACDATVRLEQGGDGWRAVGFTAPAPPDGLKVEVDEPPLRTTGGYRDAITEPGRFRASRRWWTPMVIFLTFFVLFWDGFLVFWYAMAFSGLGAPGGVRLVMVLFPLFHVAVGVGLTWFVLATWLNRTTIEVEGGRMTCRHGPIPWPFGKAEPIALDAVDLFETEEAVSRFGNHRRGRSSRSWKVVARTEDGRRVPVVTRLGDERQAKFLARRLDAQLG